MRERYTTTKSNNGANGAITDLDAYKICSKETSSGDLVGDSLSLALAIKSPSNQTFNEAISNLADRMRREGPDKNVYWAQVIHSGITLSTNKIAPFYQEQPISPSEIWDRQFRLIKMFTYKVQEGVLAKDDLLTFSLISAINPTTSTQNQQLLDFFNTGLFNEKNLSVIGLSNEFRAEDQKLRGRVFEKFTQHPLNEITTEFLRKVANRSFNDIGEKLNLFVENISVIYGITPPPVKIHHEDKPGNTHALAQYKNGILNINLSHVVDSSESSVGEAILFSLLHELRHSFQLSMAVTSRFPRAEFRSCGTIGITPCKLGSKYQSDALLFGLGEIYYQTPDDKTSDINAAKAAIANYTNSILEKDANEFASNITRRIASVLSV